MLKLVEGLLDVCGHGYVTNPLVIVPINGETAIVGSSPVNGDSIELLERLDEMVHRVFADVIDTKIVDHKGEADVFWKHATKDTCFSLVVDNFGVKYVGKDTADHLIQALKKLYTISIRLDCIPLFRSHR